MISVAALLAALTIPAAPANVHIGDCPDGSVSSGCYFPMSNDIWVKDPADEVTFQHEMGHAFIAQRLNSGERHAFSCLPAMRATFGDPQPCHHPWNEETEEKAADAYSNCALKLVPSRVTFVDAHGYEPTTDRRHLNLCRFIVRAV